MQTFLPYPNFIESLKCLDNKRLGNQRVESRMIIKILKYQIKSRWANHPAVRMWAGYEEALALYYNLSIVEWVNRGFINNLEFESIQYDKLKFPPWLGDEKIHNSHKSNLLRKNPTYYSKFNWTVPDHLKYYWPIT